MAAVLWRGDLVQVQSGGTIAVDSGSPDIEAHNWLGGFAIPCSWLLGLLVVYGGRRRPGRRRAVLAMLMGALVILNGRQRYFGLGPAGRS